MKRHQAIGGFLLVLSLRAATVEPGEPAPALGDVAGWAFGAPVLPADQAHKAIRVFILFSPDSAPCRDGMPRFAQWQERYKDRGVIFAGLAHATEDVLNAFSTNAPPPFAVAMDPERTTAGTWWKDVVELPTAVVVGPDGVVAWKGYALDGLQDHIESLLAPPPAPAPEPAAPASPVESSAPEAPPTPETQAEFDEQLLRLMADRNYDQAMGRIEGRLAQNPRQPDLQRAKAGLLILSGNDAAFREQCATMVRLAEGDPNTLNDLAWMMARPSDLPLKYLDPQLALAAAEEAVRLTDRADPAFLDTLAHALYRVGRTEEALSATREALALLPANAPEEAVDLQATAAFFERVLAMNAPAVGKTDMITLPPLPAADDTPSPTPADQPVAPSPPESKE